MILSGCRTSYGLEGSLLKTEGGTVAAGGELIPQKQSPPDGGLFVALGLTIRREQTRLKGEIEFLQD